MHDIDYSRLMVALDTDPPGPCSWCVSPVSW